MTAMQLSGQKLQMAVWTTFTVLLFKSSIPEFRTEARKECEGEKEALFFDLYDKGIL